MPLLTEPLSCQVCGRRLVPLRDGTSRRHGRYGGCSGSGYRLEPWSVGQLLAHYAGSFWEVVAVEPYYGRSYEWMVEYTMRCLSDPYKNAGREVGSTDTFHGEYLHRHGWTPVEADSSAPQDFRSSEEGS